MWPGTPTFEISYDLEGRGEPRVRLYKPGTHETEEVIPLSEAERRRAVPKERAERAWRENQRIRDTVARLKKQGKTSGPNG